LHLLVKETTALNEISVYESTELYGELGKFRYLQFSDDAVQGAIDLKDPKRIVLEYPRAIIHLMESNHPSFGSIFVIGHGIGTIAGRYPDKRLLVAEIDEKVVELSRMYFHYRGDHVRIGDGRLLLEQVDLHSLDYVVVDAFTQKGTPRHLTSSEFFRLTKDKLISRGAVILNLMGKPGNDKRINAIYTTLHEHYLYAKAFYLPGTDGADIHNMLLIAGDQEIQFHPREMAGFQEVELEPGYVIVD
jgi:spermidine synthase